VHCLYIIGPAIFEYNKRLILLSVAPLSGGHCIEIIKNRTVGFLKKLIEQIQQNFSLGANFIWQTLFLKFASRGFHFLPLKHSFWKKVKALN
jgi:hypothetical protein